MTSRPFLALLCAAAFGQSTLSLPAWLVPFPGATEETRTYPSFIESSYRTRATPTALIAHYAKLFEAAGLAFAPSFDGMGTVVRASVPGCDLLIKIREQDGSVTVRTSCAVKTPAMVAVSTPPTPPSGTRAPATTSREGVAHEDSAGPRGDDQSIAYSSAPRTVPKWPEWLLHPAGTPISYRRNTGQSTFLTAAFDVSWEAGSVHTFYTDLLESHGCAISGQGRAWLESSCQLNPHSITRLIVRIELSPAPAGTHVQMRVSSIP